MTAVMAGANLVLLPKTTLLYASNTVLVQGCTFEPTHCKEREKKDFQTNDDTSIVGNDSFCDSITNQRKFILRNHCKI